MSKTVKDHFDKVFPTHKYRGDEDSVLSSMPLDSQCGSDCKKAIDAAKPLLKHIAAAYGTGTESWHHPKGGVLREEIGEAVYDVCAVYICG